MQELVAQLRLQPGDRVLDVGCGTGGGDFLMASQHGASVHGIDLSVNMVLMALERAQQEQASLVLPSPLFLTPLEEPAVLPLLCLGINCAHAASGADPESDPDLSAAGPEFDRLCAPRCRVGPVLSWLCVRSDHLLSKIAHALTTGQLRDRGRDDGGAAGRFVRRRLRPRHHPAHQRQAGSVHEVTPIAPRPVEVGMVIHSYAETRCNVWSKQCSQH